MKRRVVIEFDIEFDHLSDSKKNEAYLRGWLRKQLKQGDLVMTDRTDTDAGHVCESHFATPKKVKVKIKK